MDLFGYELLPVTEHQHLQRILIIVNSHRQWADLTVWPLRMNKKMMFGSCWRRMRSFSGSMIGSAAPLGAETKNISTSHGHAMGSFLIFFPYLIEYHKFISCLPIDLEFFFFKSVFKLAIPHGRRIPLPTTMPICRRSGSANCWAFACTAASAG